MNRRTYLASEAIALRERLTFRMAVLDFLATDLPPVATVTCDRDLLSAPVVGNVIRLRLVRANPNPTQATFNLPTMVTCDA